MNRRFTETNAHMERRFSELANLVKEMTFVPRAEFDLALAIRDVKIADLEKDLKAALDRETWRNRALVTAFIFPILLLLLGTYLATGPR